MATIKVSQSTAGRVDGGSNQRLIVHLAQQHARVAIGTAAIAALTDSSGGAADANRKIVPVLADLVNAANSGTNLADSTTGLAKLNLVKDAILELATKASAVAVAIGAPSITYNGGGTAVDGTIAAIGSASAAATGCKATETNASIIALDNALFSVAKMINTLLVATNKPKLVIDRAAGVYSSTVAAVTPAIGTPADPGVTAAAFNAKLVLFSNNIATLAVRVNDLRSAYVPDVLVVE